MRKLKGILRYLKKCPSVKSADTSQSGMEGATRALEGSVVALSDSDKAGDGSASWIWEARLVPNHGYEQETDDSWIPDDSVYVEKMVYRSTKIQNIRDRTSF